MPAHGLPGHGKRSRDPRDRGPSGRSPTPTQSRRNSGTPVPRRVTEIPALGAPRIPGSRPRREPDCHGRPGSPPQPRRAEHPHLRRVGGRAAPGAPRKTEAGGGDTAARACAAAAPASRRGSARVREPARSARYRGAEPPPCPRFFTRDPSHGEGRGHGGGGGGSSSDSHGSLLAAAREAGPSRGGAITKGGPIMGGGDSLRDSPRSLSAVAAREA
ncbi:hypothetical protein NN561_019775 [Cricetulus griseus]